MSRKRVTEVFPCLIPLRVRQRKYCYYLKMKFDNNKYAYKKQKKLLPVLQFESRCPMYNERTGFDMHYQKNKVHNLKVAARSINKLLIYPGETFSFAKTTQYADKKISYKEGLVVINGKLTTKVGGGMCQLSNLLFWVFLHSPLTIVERKGHAVKDFPEPPSDAPLGVDATVSEGLVDLKVKNNTNYTFQINIGFDSECITGKLYTDYDKGTFYQVVNENIGYYRENSTVFEEVDIIQEEVDKTTNQIYKRKKLYRNRCKIAYQLPEDTVINCDR